VDKEHILREIQRTAEANGGTPLGRARFVAETGIPEHHWRGRYWARWSEAISEAGLEPNQLQSSYIEGDLLRKLAEEIRRFGRMPTASEMKLKRRDDDTFPGVGAFERFGPRRRGLVGYATTASTIPSTPT
jgi:hypothetical protein